MKNNQPVLVIVGPTGVGKTGFSLELVERLGGEIVSADARQAVRLMDIGTAKPSLSDRERVPHHLLDIVDPDEKLTAGEYARQAVQAIQRIRDRGKTPVVVGGSGLYIRALTEGLFEESPWNGKWAEEGHESPSGGIRKRLESRAALEGSAGLHGELKRVDPRAAVRIHPNDLQRILRALLVFEMTGHPISDLQGARQAGFEPRMVGLALDREALYRRIDIRVDAMIRDGLVVEVRGLLKSGYGPELNALASVGYQEVLPYLEGRESLGDTIEAIKRNTRRYAKRQMTWFRRDGRIFWLDASEDRKRLVDRIVAREQTH
ncbi:MAG: tRNA (adenosine(37)-N6)-dimethylallyltransferase MiaA [Candidatus Latescibacterota bacterium]